MIVTRSNITKLDIDSVINDYISGDKLDEILILVPTNRKLRKLKKKIIDASPGKIVTTLYIETLTTLSQKLLFAHSPFVELSEFTAMVLLEKITEEIKLNYFAVYSEGIPYGTLMKIKDVISEYKRSGVTPDLLIKEAEKLEGADRKKAIDIHQIYKKYLEKAGELNAFEIGDVYAELLSLKKQEFLNIFNTQFNNVNTIVAFDFDEFTSPEAEILARLSEAVNDNLFINFDYYAYNSLLFSHLDKTYERLIARGFKQIDDLAPEISSGFKKDLRENLFKRKIKRIDRYKDKLSVIKAHTRKNEVEAIAKKIKNLIVKENIKPNDICVSFNLINNYSDIVRYVFNESGIPFNITDRISLDKSPPVTAIINLFEILESDFFYKSILRVSLNGFLTLNETDTNSLLNVSRGLKIIAGRTNWINRINYALANPYSDEVFNIPKETLQKALTTIDYLYNLLKAFTEPLSTTEFINELKALIEKTELINNILNKSGENTEANIKAVTVFIENVEEVLLLFSRSESGTVKHNLDYYFEIIRTIAKASRFNVKEKSDYGVLVTNIEEIRGLKFKYLFIGGMIDKDFPTQYSPEVFVTGDFAKGEKIHLTEQRYRFYRGLSTWTNGLYLSYPLTEEKTEYVESSFLKEFKNLFDYESIDSSDFESIVSSAFEFQKNYSRINEEEKNRIWSQYNLREREILERLREIDVSKLKDESILPEFNGFLTDVDIKGENKLKEEAVNEILNLKEKVYSVSQLETYAKCPFKYFVERILRVEKIMEPTEDIAAIELGGLVHEILYEFYSVINENSLFLPGCSDNVFNAAAEILFEIAATKLDSPQFDSPAAFYEKEKLLGIGGNKKDSILFKFLETERESDPKFRPLLFEMPFGLKDKKGKEIPPVNFNGVKLRGKIDRVEIDEENKLFNVVDYKLGANRITKADLLNGLALQLPVYLYAVQSLLGEEYQPNQMIIYSLKYNPKEFGRKNISKYITNKDIPGMDDPNTEAIRIAGEKIYEYVENISKGIFPLSSLSDRRTKVCQYCGFSSICRINEVE